MKQLTIDVSVRPKSYEIRIGHHLTETIADELKEHPLGARYALITDSHVGPLYAGAMARALQARGLNVRIYTFAEGEENKNRTVWCSLLDQLLNDRYGRDSCVLALGGGVVGDMAGYVAASYMRGIPYVQIPTTVLAQVDSSIGGKTAIDTPQGKNLLGAFYHPVRIYMDMDTLKTLSPRHYRAGLVELIKHGLIYDPALLSFYQAHEDTILNRKLDENYYMVMEELMERNCAVKNAVVSQDDHEKGLRKILNYGHTFGHAVEILSGFDLIHGEAVAVGIRFAAELSLRLGLLRPEDVKLHNEILDRLQMPCKVQADADQVMETMVLDKKSRNGRPELILLDRIGHVYTEPDGGYGHQIDQEILLDVMRGFLESTP